MTFTPQQIADLIVYAAAEELPVLTDAQDEAVERAIALIANHIRQDNGQKFRHTEDAAISLLGQALAQLQSQVAAQGTLLAARELALEKASKDSERLDWLDQEEFTQSENEITGDEFWYCFRLIFDSEPISVRAAIDAAMKAKETK